MAWNVWSCDTRTGVKQLMLGPAVMNTCTWARKLNEGASGQSTIPVSDALIRQLDIKGATTPVARSIVVEWIDPVTGVAKVVYAGLIWGRKYDKDTGVLTIRHGDIWSLWQKRLLAVVNTAGIESAPPLHFTGLTPEAIARNVVFHGMNDGADYYVPVYIGTATMVGGATATYYGYHTPIVAEALEDLMDLPDGPDIDFDPEWTPGAFGFRWNLRAGALGGGPWDFHPDAPDSGLSGISYDEDATKMATNVLAIGEGSEKNMLVRSATVNPAGLPAMDVVVPLKTETVPTNLQLRANSEHTGRSVSTKQWGATLQAEPKRDGAGTKIGAGVSDLALGGTVRVHTLGDPWIPDGWHDNRLIGYSGDLGQSINLEFQPIGV